MKLRKRNVNSLKNEVSKLNFSEYFLKMSKKGQPYIYIYI